MTIETKYAIGQEVLWSKGGGAEPIRLRIDGVYVAVRSSPDGTGAVTRISYGGWHHPKENPGVRAFTSFVEEDPCISLLPMTEAGKVTEALERR
jgi:hypothetical protein